MTLPKRSNVTPLPIPNTFGIRVYSDKLLVIKSTPQLSQLLKKPGLQGVEKLVLGRASNMIFTYPRVKSLILKNEIKGFRQLASDKNYHFIEAGSGENWHDLVVWSLQRGIPGLENLALIPGTVGAAPVQNIGAYGVELSEFLSDLDVIDLQTGQQIRLNRKQCRFAYRDSIFKSQYVGRFFITHIRLAIPKDWVPRVTYHDLKVQIKQQSIVLKDMKPQQVFDWVCRIRSAKLPNPNRIGNVGSFFKNPTIPSIKYTDLVQREPLLNIRSLPDGFCKLSAAQLIEMCGWKGKVMGQVGVSSQHALVLVNLGGATGSEVFTLATAIQQSVYERFHIKLEPEPVFI